ncbi:MAG: ferredoxin family protein [Thermodesulfovibrionales bacterium]
MIKGMIVINRELCKGCTYCVRSCPKGCIEIDNGFNEMGYFPAMFSAPEGCIGCAICARMCPEIAIEVWKSE